MNKRSLGLYLHIPFCIRKCAYCDFYSVTQTELTEQYVDALIRQLESFRERCKDYIVDSIYLGGGTPSLLTDEEITPLMQALYENFHIAENAEISMEANPGTLTREKLRAYRKAGINRLSIGLQSSHYDELKTLGRIHTKGAFEVSYQLAREEGFDHISLDLMYALPNQTEKMLLETVRYAISLSPEHISFYGLKIEQGTPFGRDPLIEKQLPDEDTQYEMYMHAATILEEAGYLQYEISNFAKQGRECKHNLKYWSCEEYLGFGPAAYSLFDGEMFSYHKDIRKFIASPTDRQALFDEHFIPTEDELATQYVMVSFRLTSGIDTAVYRERFHDDFELRYGENIKPFLRSGHMEKNENGYRLSRLGMLISNYILSEILEF